jgi:hypothetical protein
MLSSRPELWPNSGHALLQPQANGWLGVTDDYLRALWQRPEVAPVDESCDLERALHAALLATPGCDVSDAEIDALADPDARENYRVVLAFRDQLVEAGSVEASYLTLFRAGDVRTPPVFIDTMTQAVTQALLQGINDPMRARAGELLFREQQATVQDGAVLLGDFETVERLGRTGGMGSLGALVVESGTAAKQVTLDVLQPETADIYWPRSENFDTVFDVTFGRPGLDALCRLLESWVARFMDVDVNIQPVQQITDHQWVWHVGLDSESSALLNDLYNDTEVDDVRMERLLSLFRLEFKDPAVMRSDVAGKPVYLGLCMTENNRLRLKPQNLLVNLPLAAEV